MVMIDAFVMEKKTTYQKGVIDQDGLWKKVIGDLFEDFLLFFAPNLYEQVDFTKQPDFLQQELFQEVMDNKKGGRTADQIVKIRLKDGKEQWVLVHIEVQGANEDDFPERMFQYFYRIYDRYKQKIIAIAVMTSPSPNTTPLDFHYTYFGTELHYAYNSHKITDYNKQDLEQSDKIFSKIVLATIYMHETKTNMDKRYAFKMKLMRDILRQYKDSAVVLQATLSFIDYLLRLSDELSEQLKGDIRPIIRKERKDMIQYDKDNWSPTMAAVLNSFGKEWKEEGIKEERSNIARTLLQKDMPLELIVEITKLTLQEVEELASGMDI